VSSRKDVEPRASADGIEVPVIFDMRPAVVGPQIRLELALHVEHHLQLRAHLLDTRRIAEPSLGVEAGLDTVREEISDPHSQDRIIPVECRGSSEGDRKPRGTRGEGMGGRVRCGMGRDRLEEQNYREDGAYGRAENFPHRASYLVTTTMPDSVTMH